MSVIDQCLTALLFLAASAAAVESIAVKWKLWPKMDRLDFYRHGGKVAVYLSVSINCGLIFLGVGLTWRLPVALLPYLFLVRGLSADLARGKRAR